MIYKCNDCNKYFSNPEQQKSTFESEYGVSSEFGSNTPCYLDICPYCKSEDIDEKSISDLTDEIDLEDLMWMIPDDDLIRYLND